MTLNFLSCSVLLSLVFSACAPPGADAIETKGSIEQAPIVQASDDSIPTIAATPTPEVTATPDILNMPMDQVAQLLAEGKIEYPANWEDTKKAELAIAFAEYLNSITADEAYTLVDGEKVGWAPATGQWRTETNHFGEEVDLTGDSLPPLVMAGYTNAEGQEIIVDPITGETTIVPKINLLGLGEKSLTELYAMGQSELRSYVIDLMLGSNDISDFLAKTVASERQNHFPLPVVIYKSALNNETIYNTLIHGSGDRQDIPEINANFWDVPTNQALVPIIDSSSGAILFWLNISQGQPTFGKGFVFAPGENPTAYDTSQVLTYSGQPYFGGLDSHSIGILFPGNSTEETYYGQGEESFLEGGIGIGSEIELQQILSANSIKDITDVLRNLRLLVLFPSQIIYQQ